MASDSGKSRHGDVRFTIANKGAKEQERAAKRPW